MKRTRLTKTECTCDRCQSACQNTPGWFRPGQAEKAAALMGLSLRQFFTRYLMVNWWEDYPENVFVLSPAVTTGQPGHEFPGNPKGTCVFFKAGRCAIHAAKPFDCSHGNPCEERTEARRAVDVAARAETVKLWRKHQKQIRTLLGRKPQAAAYSYLDSILW